ncbi:MAG: hypothetical protein HUJ68_04985 [Clostridia bacterium]|nr:hypothetical protein [Clostridia bacterium]
MSVSINLYSEKNGELNRFLSDFYDTTLDLQYALKWEKEFKNPIELADIIGVFRDNSDSYNLSMWICLDKNIFIRVTENNTDNIIKYLFQRFPY